MILKFKTENKELLTLQLKKGNDKPIKESTYIFNLESAYYCNNKECEYHKTKKGICYALQNEIQYKQTIIRAEKDRKTIDYLVKNNLYELLADAIIKASQRSRKHKIEHLRIGERGEIKNITYLVFINNLAETLYNKIGISTTIYTHKQQLYKQFKDNYKQSKGLIIIGSNFKADIQFKAVKTLDKHYKYNCCSNCIECERIHKKALCYNMSLKGKDITIKEQLKHSNIKNLNLILPKDIIQQLKEI